MSTVSPQLNKILHSTFYILVETGEKDKSGEIFESGTGFLVADGYVVTNAHLLSNLTKEGKIYLANEVLNDPIEAELVSMDTVCEKSDPGNTDLALLKFDKKLQKSEQSPLTLNLTFQKLQSVLAIGYPYSVISLNYSHKEVLQGKFKKILEHTADITSGLINTLAEGESTSILVHSAKIMRGNSGGPLVNHAGEVVGINTWIQGHNNVKAGSSMAQPSITIAIFLKHNNILPEFVSDQTIFSWTDKSDDHTIYTSNPCLKNYQSAGESSYRKKNASVTILSRQLAPKDQID
ncbi:MAG: serine protease [Deltaproteobacteria bacterium]|nr:serine protease [Deltaproteobacteria bacterium]